MSLQIIGPGIETRRDTKSRSSRDKWSVAKRAKRAAKRYVAGVTAACICPTTEHGEMAQHWSNHFWREVNSLRGGALPSLT